MTRIITMIRHGQYDTSVTHADGGSLTAIGRQQAMQTGIALGDSTVDAIYCSTMIRARETAEIIASIIGLPVTEETPLLREVVPTVPAELRPYIDAWIAEGKAYTANDIDRQKKRADEAYTQFFTHANHAERMMADMSHGGHHHLLLVCHGNLLRYLMCKALNVSLDTWVRLTINHCGMTVFANEHDVLRLVSHNTHQHLEIPLRTE